MSIFAKYIRNSVVSLLGVAVCVSVFNAVVDPYWIYRLVEVEGVNEGKPEFENHLRMGKAHSISRIKPEGVIIGSSRSYYAYDPRHAGWRVSPVYNSGLSGGTIYELSRYMRHILAQGKLKKIVFPVDFFMFDQTEQQRADFSTDRLEDSDKPWYVNARVGWNDYLATLMSMDATKHSINTLMNQGSKGKWRTDGMADVKVRRQTIIEGEGGITCASIKGEIKQLRWMANLEGSFLVDASPNSKTIADFTEIVLSAAKEGVDVTVVFPPTHVRLFHIIYGSGQWSNYLDWRKSIVASLEQIKEQVPGANVKAWDFSNLNEYTTEAFPKAGSKEPMRGYIEFSHYTPYLGSAVLDRVLSIEGNGPDLQGRVVTNKNIVDANRKLTQQIQRYVALHKEDRERVDGYRRGVLPEDYRQQCLLRG